MRFESKKDRRIRELEKANEYLTEQLNEERERLKECGEALKEASELLEKEVSKDRRSAFAQEIGLLPCESPACQYCKNAVWYSGKDGRHIAGCRKGIRCADFEFEQAEQKPETPAPPSPNPMFRPAPPISSLATMAFNHLPW